MKKSFADVKSSDTGICGTGADANIGPGTGADTDNGPGAEPSAVTVPIVESEPWTAVKRRPGGRKNGYGRKGKEEEALFPLQPRRDFSSATRKQRY